MGTNSFEDLTPHLLIDGVEEFTNLKFTGHTNPMASYINRVYEIETEDQEKMIVKYYRPDRWSLDAIYDEHDFVLDCLEDEIPVVAPIELNNGSTLGLWDKFSFALFPKKSGPMLEITSDKDWIRVGELIARIHTCGARYNAENRIRLDPEGSTETFLFLATVPINTSAKASSSSVTTFLPSSEVTSGRLFGLAVLTIST